tara:strand:+ start:7061 stop:7231 length:171 start_codon:yes stop_codon:yes gene_type:complete
MLIYITQYIKDGKVKEGPCILASSLEVALEQAKFFDLEIIGELGPEGFITDERTLH